MVDQKPAPTSARVDAWIWAVRIVKTRSLAATACRAGHVTVNGDRAKPAQSVRKGDEVRVRLDGIERIVLVERVVLKRVGAVVAAECITDLTPPPPPPAEKDRAVVRDRGAGRPTKRERRRLEVLRGRDDDS